MYLPLGYLNHLSIKHKLSNKVHPVYSCLIIPNYLFRCSLFLWSMTFDIVIAFDTAVMRSCLIVFIVYLFHCMSLFLFLLTVYRVGQKKWTPNALHITSSNIGRFQKFFHCCNLRKICNAVVIKHLKRIATLPCEIFMSEN